MFRRNANSLQAELAACQRYYYRLTALATFSALVPGFVGPAATTSIFTVLPKVTLRVAPTSVDFSNIAVGRSVVSGPFAITAASLPSSANSNNSFSVSVDHANSGYTAFSGQDLVGNGVGSFIGFSAEL